MRLATALLAAVPSIAMAAPPCRPAPTQRLMWEPVEPGAHCLVVASGALPGTGLRYQLQAYVRPGGRPAVHRNGGPLQVGSAPGAGAGTVLLEGRRVLAGWSGAEAVVGRPSRIRVAGETLVLVPMAADVSSHPNDDVLLRRWHGRWTAVDTDAWSAGISVPPGTAQLHGAAMDWPTLRAFGAFSRPGDAACCATGGSFIAQLGLDGTRLVLRSVQQSPDELPFP